MFYYIKVMEKMNLFEMQMFVKCLRKSIVYNSIHLLFAAAPLC